MSDISCLLPLRMRLLNRDNPQEVNLVLSSWKKSHASSLKLQGEDPKVAISRIKHPVESAVQNSTVLVATAPDDDDIILGWVCADDNCLHYVYTKQLYRREEVASRLIKSIRQIHQFSGFSYYSPVIYKLLASCEVSLIYTPEKAAGLSRI